MSVRGIKALLFSPRDLSRWNGDLYMFFFRYIGEQDIYWEAD